MEYCLCADCGELVIIENERKCSHCKSAHVIEIGEEIYKGIKSQREYYDRHFKTNRV